MMDLWGFKNAKSLENIGEYLPDMILKKQFNLLADKTEGVLYGKSTNIKINEPQLTDGYRLATIYDVVVPRLDNYSSTIIIVYSYPDKEYPVAITVGKSYIDDCECFSPDFVCRNEEEFKKVARNILSSQDVTKKIMLLYSKAAV